MYLIGVWGTSKPAFLAEAKPRLKKPVLRFPKKPTRHIHGFLLVVGPILPVVLTKTSGTNGKIGPQ